METANLLSLNIFLINYQQFKDSSSFDLILQIHFNSG
jgi:hypothetical protein